MSASWRRVALLALVPVTLIAGAVAPLALGQRTLILRDTLNTHLVLRTALGRAIRTFELPLIDPLRSGGQALLGNLNAVPLYPDNLLLLVSSDLWQLNAHFWLHWLLVLPAMFGLARLWGLGREAAVGAATFYAFSGYFFSQLNLYNGVAGVTLAPLLAASLLASAEPRWRRWALPALGGAWALELVAGDPIVAVIALGAAVVLAAADRREIPWRGVALALLAGTLVAAPQWIETLRLLPGSFRGVQGMGTLEQDRGSPSPAAAIELLLPLFFGRPDLHGTWGANYFGGQQQIYYSLAPGALLLAALVVGCRSPGRRERWAVLLLVASSALAFSGGSFSGLLARLPGGEAFRYSVKFALGGMLGASLLAARGLERSLADATHRRILRLALLLLLAVEVAFVVLFVAGDSPLLTALREVFARGLDDAAFTAQRPGWAAGALWQALTAAIALLPLAVARRRPVMATAGLLALQAFSQMLPMRALIATDETAPYRRPPALLAAIPRDAVTAHAGSLSMFGDRYLEEGTYPDARWLWRERRAYEELRSWALPASGRRGEFDPSAEGLDAFPVQATLSAMNRLSDVERIRVLAATGVDRLVLPRALDPSTEAVASLIVQTESEPAARVYAIEGALRDAQLVGNASHVPEMGAAIAALTSPDFDPRRDAVLAGVGPPRREAPGTVETGKFAADEIVLEVESPGGGALVVRRAWLPIWRVEIDGQPGRVTIANLTRLATELPPGRHAVRFHVPRWPFGGALALSCLGGIGLLWLGRRTAAERT